MCRRPAYIMDHEGTHDKSKLTKYCCYASIGTANALLPVFIARTTVVV